MNLFILFLLVVQSYATDCPDGQFYLVEIKTSGTCTTHVSSDACDGIAGGSASPQPAVAMYSYISNAYGMPYAQRAERDMTSWYPFGCQRRVNQGDYPNQMYPNFQIRYANSDNPQVGQFDGGCDSGIHNAAAPAPPPYGPPPAGGYTFDTSTNQGGTNCFCAPPGEDDAVCVAGCPVGSARRNADTVPWDSCDAIPGCMNPAAINYDPLANKESPDDCEYCEYDQGMFWLIGLDTEGQNDCDLGAGMCEALGFAAMDLNNPLVAMYPYRYPKYCSSMGYNPALLWAEGAEYRPCGRINEYVKAVCDADEDPNDDWMGMTQCDGMPLVESIFPGPGELCLCPPPGHSTPQCVNECPLRADGTRGLRRWAYNFDDCTGELPGCIDPLYKEYTPEATMNTPHRIAAADGTKITDPRACQTLSCESVSAIYDNQCLPDGQC